MESTSAKRRHIIEIDYVRMIVIGLVITTHIAATGVFYNSVTSGFVWMLTHTSRNVFFLLSALVLFYVYQSGRKMNAWTFYARRFGLVAAPYAAWTAIYLVRDGATTGHSVSYFLSRYIYDLATANAMYHLYFMLVIMQLYVIFPFIYRSVPLLKRKGRVIFAISLLVQLVFTTAMFYQWNGGPWLNWWLAHPDNYIWSYQFYIVLGALIALNLERFEELVARHHRAIVVTVGIVALVGEILYFTGLGRHLDPATASATFQPYQVVESLVFTIGLLSAGFNWSRRGAPYRRAVGLLSENSFGIYLSHVLVISYLVFLQPQSHGWIATSLSILIGVPLVYGLSLGICELLRQTYLSLVLTGRPHTNRLWTFMRAGRKSAGRRDLADSISGDQ